MTKLQNIFHSITGFKASHISQGAEAEGWKDWNADTLIDVVDNLGLEGVDSDESEHLHAALTEFKNCNTGQGSDLDAIFNKIN